MIGFYAILSNDISHLGDGQAIEFDQVITNIGQAYDSRHGHFTAPVSGMYLISASIMSTDKKHVNCYIVKNGSVVGYLFGGESDYQADTKQLFLTWSQATWFGSGTSWWWLCRWTDLWTVLVLCWGPDKTTLNSTCVTVQIKWKLKSTTSYMMLVIFTVVIFSVHSRLPLFKSLASYG